MKRLLQTLGALLLVAIVMCVFALVYSTAKGYMSWYFRVDGQVRVDGQMTSGYLHANTQRTILLITRTDGDRKETYLIPVSDRAMIMDCGDWNPVRFLSTPVGDVNPPCSVFTDPAKVFDAPLPASLVRERRSVSFTTASGKKVRAEW